MLNDAERYLALTSSKSPAEIASTVEESLVVHHILT